MAIPDVEPKEILAALMVFDQELRDQPEWENWEDQSNFKWAIEHGERRYPVKKILNIATGLPLNSFSGGPEANSYVRTKGFTVVPLRGDSENEDVQAALVVRAGQRGVLAESFMALSVIAVGWKWLGDLSSVKSREQLR